MVHFYSDWPFIQITYVHVKIAIDSQQWLVAFDTVTFGYYSVVQSVRLI